MPWETLALAAAAAVCYLLIRRIGRGREDDSRSAKLMKKYQTLTPDLLAATDDDELVEAVVSHVLARAADQRRPDPVVTLSQLPQPFTVVYSIWAVGKELARGDYAALSHTATRGMVDAAVDALPVVGASDTAAALAALRDVAAAKGDTAVPESVYHRAAETECPLSLCVGYIRDHIPQLTDTAAPE